MKRFLSNILILFGVICYLMVIYAVYERVNPRRVSFAAGKYATASIVNNQNVFPVRIDIAKVSISLPIIPSSINNDIWEATTEGVSYLTSSPLPGETGNSILYGHNWQALLGPLVLVRPGDTIEITFSDNSKKVFDVEYTVTVTPDQVHILEQSSDKRITLYTCTGFLDTKRFVVVGILK